MTRRGLFATLLAPVVAKALPAPVAKPTSSPHLLFEALMPDFRRLGVTVFNANAERIGWIGSSCFSGLWTDGKPITGELAEHWQKKLVDFKDPFEQYYPPNAGPRQLWTADLHE